MAYEKQEVKAGDIMDPNWGNHVQTQYEKAKQDFGIVEEVHNQDSIQDFRCVRFGNGLQLCFGNRISTSNTNGGITFPCTFPVGFLNNNYSAFAIPDSSSYINFGLTVNKTSENATFRGLGFEPSKEYRINVFAIGPWK